MTDPGIREAMVTLEKLSQDEQTRRAARAREEAARMRRKTACPAGVFWASFSWLWLLVLFAIAFSPAKNSLSRRFL